MFRKNYSVRIHLPGGIMAAGDLYALAEAAGKAKVEELQFGTRQQLFCKVPDKYGPAFLRELEKAGLSYETDEEKYPNIVSSYVGSGIFETGGWVTEGLYKDILDGFDFRPSLKINLVEANQSFVPFFTGNINFISSPVGNYWYLYIRWPLTGTIYPWKEWIYSRDIPRISRLIEEEIARNKSLYSDNPSADGDLLYRQVQERGSFVTQPIREALRLPPSNLPYYEGFNRYGNKLWLGIYRRDETFPLSFLRDISLICLQTKVGQLYTTPWKSLIVKGIAPEDRYRWDYALGKYRINVRHASNELNWQVEDLCEEGLRLKRWLVRQFDNEDTRTYGLCFAVKTRQKSGLFGSVIIRKQVTKRPQQSRLLDRYDILHTRDFNANTKEHILYREGLEKENLGAYLVSLCKYFYELQSKDDLPSPEMADLEREQAPRQGISGPEKQEIFQCRHCLTLYNVKYGDPVNGEPAGRRFGDTAADYECPVCGGPKEDFRALQKTASIQ